MFISPEDRATVPASFEARWATTGLIVERGSSVNREDGSGGYLHLLINTEDTPGGEGIPADDRHLRFRFGGRRLSAEFNIEARRI